MLPASSAARASSARLLLALALCCAAGAATAATTRASASARASAGGSASAFSSASSTASAGSSNDGWRTGRATFYGVDGWSIHKGSCGFGYQYKNVGTGWDAAAISDASPEFAGSCGRCYEVRCDARQVIDGYGNRFDRSSACKAGAASVVVRTVDACPCQYPSNAYSNKRWCCGDNSNTQGTHFDLSIWAFEKLADTNNGVAGVQFRPVLCDHAPAQRAPDGPTGMPPSEQPKALGYPGTGFDPPGAFYQQPLVMRFDDTGKEQGAVRPMKSFDGEGAQVVTQGQILESGATAVASASWSSSSGSAQATASAQSSTDNGCTDTPPAGSTCAQQKADGNCGQPWMLSGNYCRATCGRCALGGGASASATSTATTAATPTGCIDLPPPGQSGCADQKAWGNCQQGWFKEAGYCAATCGRCSSGSSASASATATTAGCTDVSPPGQSGCADQKAWGNCQQGWFEEGGYCATTCGRCGKN